MKMLLGKEIICDVETTLGRPQAPCSEASATRREKGAELVHQWSSPELCKNYVRKNKTVFKILAKNYIIIVKQRTAGNALKITLKMIRVVNGLIIFCPC